MASAVKTMLKKCTVYFDDCFISSERILEKYLSFFVDSIDSPSRQVGLALHTGSVCFDVVSVVAIALGCLSYNLSTNDDIIASLQPGDMVMYKGQRHRWIGLEQSSGRTYFVLEQDGTGKNGLLRCSYLYENNKHLIQPYYGESTKTDGRGVKRRLTNRESFLSYILDLPLSEIPTQIDASTVVVADRGVFADIFNKVSIHYDTDKCVGLLDIVPASYFTSGGNEYPFGSNPTKADSVLKVTGDLSTARSLVLNKHGNKVIGAFISGNTVNLEDSSELTDLLRRKTLQFVVISSPLQSGVGDRILGLYDDISVFACTKEYLSSARYSVGSVNRYTNELHRQTSAIINNTIHAIKVTGGLPREKYLGIRNLLLRLKQSEWDSELRDEFIVTAQGILNLLNTAVFSMAEIEQAIAENKINPTVKSPRMRIDYLWNITENAGVMQEICMTVTDALEELYNGFLEATPKESLLDDIVAQKKDLPVAVITPKAYYADIIKIRNPELYSCGRTVCVTPNRFDQQAKYDTVIVLGEVFNRRFDALKCISSKDVYILLYECEEKAFAFRKRRQQRFENDLNKRIGLITVDETPESYSEQDKEFELEMQRFESLDEYIDSYNLFDIRKLAVGASQTSGGIPTSEVTHIGVFSSGDQIFLSKYYSAVVFDELNGTVIEKSPSDLKPGDVMVFTKRDDYTRNIVDDIYDKLLASGKLSQQSYGCFQKSRYWKTALRNYKDSNMLSYRDVTLRLQALGSSMQEVSVRQWLVEDSHIVGPRDMRSMQYIAQLTQDPFLLDNPQDYFEACRHVRSERREILKLIAKAIKNKLMGFSPQAGSVLEVVYENVERLSETKELENISEIDESVNISINLVNRPITESEVLL